MPNFIRKEEITAWLFPLMNKTQQIKKARGFAVCASISNRDWLVDVFGRDASRRSFLDCIYFF